MKVFLQLMKNWNHLFFFFVSKTIASGTNNWIKMEPLELNVDIEFHLYMKNLLLICLKKFYKGTYVISGMRFWKPNFFSVNWCEHNSYVIILRGAIIFLKSAAYGEWSCYYSGTAPIELDEYVKTETTRTPS